MTPVWQMFDDDTWRAIDAQIVSKIGDALIYQYERCYTIYEKTPRWRIFRRRLWKRRAFDAIQTAMGAMDYGRKE